MQIPTIKAVATRPASQDDGGAAAYVRSYLVMRLAIGALAMALPLLLVAMVDVIEGSNPATRGSMSADYYTGAQDLFVGVLCVIGVFLIG
jgi:hypothetical protein